VGKVVSAGEAWERRVEAEGQALGVWVKVPNKRTVKGAQTAGSVWLDFVGCVEGRMITGDAKWVGARRRVTSSLLSRPQREHAERALEAGAVAVVIVGWLDGSESRCALVDWSRLRSEGVDLAPSPSWVDEARALVARSRLSVLAELEAVARDADAPAAARVRALEVLGKATGELDERAPVDASKLKASVLRYLPTEALREAIARAKAEQDE
jgi:hypothetical protein